MPVYSHSQLSVFEQCPQRYKFHYIDKVRKPEEQGIEAFVGSRVHETLQKLYEDLQYGKLSSLEELVTFYNNQWRCNWKPEIRIVHEGFSEENYRDYGRRCIENYYRRHEPFNESQTLKTEFHVSFPLDPQGRYKVHGYIDRLARRSDRVYEIHDYKTGSGLPTQADVDADRQLALYHIGLKSCWNDVERVDLIWHYVGLDTTLISHRSDQELDELSRSTMGLIDQIQSCKDFRPVKSVLCDWCEYRPECPEWRHVLAVQKMSPQAVAADDGVRLVNEYAAVKSELDSVSARLAGLRCRLVACAQERCVNVLQGNGARALITSREHAVFPSRGTDAWRRMEELIKASDRWDEVRELSVSRLAEAMRNQEWPPPLLAELDKFVQQTTVVTVRLLRSQGSTPDSQLEEVNDEDQAAKEE